MARLLEHGRGIRRRLLVEVLASEPDWMRHATLAVELLLASSSLSHSLLVVEQREVVGLLDGMRGGRGRHPAQHRRRLLALRSSQQVVVGGSELLLLRLLVEEAGEAAACVVLRHDSAELVGIGVLLRKEEEGLRDVDILVDVDVLHVLVGYVGLDLLVFTRHLRLHLFLPLGWNAGARVRYKSLLRCPSVVFFRWHHGQGSSSGATGHLPAHLLVKLCLRGP